MAKPPTYRNKWPQYRDQWNAMQITRPATVRGAAKRLFAAKDRYVTIEHMTGVPWWMIAVIHLRESDQDFRKSLAQGDRWDRVSTHVPAGRGPFRSFEAAAYDALVTLKRLDLMIDWRLEKVLYQLERYNGWGYHWHRVPSPYLWGSTNIQRPGKYVRDRVWSSTAWDVQLGCAPVIRALMDLDPTIQPIRET